MGTYKKVYFCGGRNIDLNIITCKDKFIITSILYSYILHCYHMYLLHPGMYRTELMIR